MTKCKMNIWGREFELPLVYECYDGEEVLESQKEAFALLERNSDETDDSLNHVKRYVKKTGADSLADNEIENIFRYVMPKSIFVPHSKSHQIAAILCNYKFDAEHGIAVIFENGHFKKIGPQDIVL
jgi:hypothetical protein